MPCEVKKTIINGEPVTMILCSRGQQPKEKCYICGGPGYFLCDGDKGAGNTCDRPLCGLHAYMPNAFENKHLCPECRARKETQDVK